MVGTAQARIFPCATASVALPCINDTTSPSAFGCEQRHPNHRRYRRQRTQYALRQTHRSRNPLPWWRRHRALRHGRDPGRNSPPERHSRADPRSYQALGTLEYHGPKLDVYAYVGGEYGARTAYVNAAGAGVGYGSPLFNNAGCRTETLPTSANSALTSVNLSGGTGAPTKTGLSPTAYNGFLPGALGACTADTRNLIEGTLGFWYRFYNGPKGRLQSGLQYSYTVRNTWSGIRTKQESLVPQESKHGPHLVPLLPAVEESGKSCGIEVPLS